MCDSEVRETIGCEAHRRANSSYTEGRFAAASKKLTSRKAANPGACSGKQRAGGAMRDAEVRETIGCESHRRANSSYTEGRFAVASKKLTSRKAANSGAWSGKQGEETGMKGVV